MIEFLKPLVDQDEATAALSPASGSFLARLFRKRAELCRVEMIFLPFYVFEGRLVRRDEERRPRISIDGIGGNACLYSDENFETTRESNAPTCEPLVSEGDAKTQADAYCRGLVLERGLQVKIHFTLEDVRFLKQVRYPFWVGYLRRGGTYDFRAVDGMTGDLAAGRMRRVFLKVFREMDDRRNLSDRLR